MFFEGKQAVAFTSRCSVYRSADQLLQHDTPTRINFNRALYDNDSEWDLVTNFRFIAKKAGLYHISALLFYLFINAGVMCNCDIKKTGVTVKQRSTVHYAQVNEFSAISADVPLNVDDYIEIWGRHKNGNAQYVSSTNYRTFCDIHQIA